MTYQSNHDLEEAIRQIAETIALDNHDGFRRYVTQKLLKHGIIDALPESLLDPYRPCPPDWTALQIAYFDNGEPEHKRKRKKLQRTRVRLGGNIKAWTREQINFASEKQVSWQANFYCWTARDALTISKDLWEEKLIDETTMATMEQAVAETSSDPALRFSIPLLKTTGTRWMKEHVVITKLGEGGLPEQVILMFPNQKMVGTREPMSGKLPNGNSFAGTTIRQARLAKPLTLASWATEIVA